jgi:hypothetical protein
MAMRWLRVRLDRAGHQIFHAIAAMPKEMRDRIDAFQASGWHNDDAGVRTRWMAFGG